MKSKFLLLTLAFALITGCTGGGGSSSPKPAPQPTPAPPAPPPLTTGVKGMFRSLKQNTNAAHADVAFAVGASAATQTMTPRVSHRAIQMMNGKVLLVGGDLLTNYPVTAPSMDIYDPATETFTVSAAHPVAVRQHKTGTGSLYNDFGIVNLPDGKVAIVGCNTGGDYGTWTECHFFDIYDPVADTLDRRAVTDETGAAGNTIHLDSISEAYYIGNNTLLLFNSFGMIQTLNLVSGKLLTLPTGPMLGPDQYTNSVGNAPTIQDANGNVWLVGGTEITSEHKFVPYIFMYDVAAGTWSHRKDMAVPRAGTALVLQSGNRLGIYGGTLADGTASSAVEIYDIAADTISPAPALVGSRFNTSGVYLQTGFTLIAGGESATDGVVSSEIVHRYDATYNFSGSTGSMVHARSTHTVTPLSNGLVLIAGGGDATANNTAEVYDPLTKLLVQFTTDTMVVSTTQAFSTTYTTAVSWSSSKPTVASVSASGTVTALLPGEVEITATANDDSTLTAVVRLRIIPQ